MDWLPDGEKNFEDIFIRFGATHERDRRTDGRTPHAGNSRAMHSIARYKLGNLLFGNTLYVGHQHETSKSVGRCRRSGT